MLDPLVQNHHLVEALWSAVNTSAGSIPDIGPLIQQIIETGAWRERKIPQLNGALVTHVSFRRFIEEPPLRGCGWKIGDVEALIKDQPEILMMWRRATTAPKGRPELNGDNVTIKSRRGNSRAYILDRLERERPDLFQRVLDGAMSANAAAIEAGWKKKPMITCPECGHKFQR